jgi:hypothetical protein
MPKFRYLEPIKTAHLDSFVYVPPTPAMKAARVLVLANLGYAMGSAPALNWGTLASVLRGLRRATPFGRIVITDKICPVSSAEGIFERLGIQNALDEEMRIVASEGLLVRIYQNPLVGAEFAEFTAPEALADYDCVVNVTTFEANPKMTLGTLATLEHVLPCDFSGVNKESLYHDLYWTLGTHIDDNVLEVRSKPTEIRVYSGENMLGVDVTVCNTLGVGIPSYITRIETTREAQPKN